MLCGCFAATAQDLDGRVVFVGIINLDVVGDELYQVAGNPFPKLERAGFKATNVDAGGPIGYSRSQ